MKIVETKKNDCNLRIRSMESKGFVFSFSYVSIST